MRVRTYACVLACVCACVLMYLHACSAFVCAFVRAWVCVACVCVQRGCRSLRRPTSQHAATPTIQSPIFVRHFLRSVRRPVGPSVCTSPARQSDPPPCPSLTQPCARPPASGPRSAAEPRVPDRKACPIRPSVLLCSVRPAGPSVGFAPSAEPPQVLRVPRWR